MNDLPPPDNEMVVDYASPELEVQVSARSLLRAAYLYAIAPMVAGFAILTAYYVTRSGLWVILGILALVLGMVSIVMGAVCLSMYLKRSNSKLVNNKLVVFLLLLNLPVAGVCVVAGVSEMMSVYVPLTLTNNGRSAISDITLTTPRGDVHYNRIDAGQTIHRTIDATDGGVLAVSGTLNGKQFSADIRQWGDADASQSDKSGVRVNINDAGDVAVIPPN